MSAKAAFSPRRLAALLSLDARSVVREPTLLAVVLMALAPCLAFAAAGDAIDRFAEARAGLSGFGEAVLPFVLVLPGLLLGWTAGMLVAENRDEGVLTSLRATPLGEEGLLAYRAAVAASLGGLVAGVAVASLVEDTQLLAVLPVMAAMEAATVAIALPKLAGNLVEGLALSKFLSPIGASSLLPLVASPIGMIGGVLPPYWFGELIGAVQDGSLPAEKVVGGLVVHAVWLAGAVGAWGRMV